MSTDLVEIGRLEKLHSEASGSPLLTDEGVEWARAAFAAFPELLQRARRAERLEETLGNIEEGRMCKWGTNVILDLPIAAHLSHTGERYMKQVGVDACIAPIVKALNDAGIETVASCCGHDRGPGDILLADGRVLIITAGASLLAIGCCI